MRRLIFVLLALFVFAPCIAHADMLEIKGRGVISGRVLSEENGDIVFRDSWGETQTFKRDQIVFLQREGGGGARRKDGSNRAWSAPAFSIESFTALFTKGDPIAATREIANSFFLTALEYLAGDATAVIEAAKDAVRHVMATSSKGFTATNYGTGIGGIVLIGIGLIALAAFSFHLIINAFDQGFLWGTILLADGLVFLAPVFGGALGLVMILPYFMTVYFVLRFWEDARLAVVGQLFSLNIVTLGYIILKGTFLWQ